MINQGDIWSYKLYKLMFLYCFWNKFLFLPLEPYLLLRNILIFSSTGALGIIGLQSCFLFQLPAYNILFWIGLFVLGLIINPLVHNQISCRTGLATKQSQLQNVEIATECKIERKIWLMNEWNGDGCVSENMTRW